jgi:hypothetical protein
VFFEIQKSPEDAIERAEACFGDTFRYLDKLDEEEYNSFAKLLESNTKDQYWKNSVHQLNKIAFFIHFHFFFSHS